MANYISAYRTNYFRVTDEDKYNELIKKLSGEDFELFDKTAEDGTVYHGFGGYGGIAYDANGTEDFDEYIDDFLEDLRPIIPKDESVIFTEVGHEKLRYVTGYSTIVTHDGIECINLTDAAKDKAKEMLKKDDYTTTMEY